MTEQSTWIPLPAKKRRTASLDDAKARADKMIDWYEANRPSVKSVHLSVEDYKAFELAVGGDAKVTKDGIKYRGFTLKAAAK